ncbi:uncharacterized protein LOC121416727 [Lytechinus variegatus]|uniref:uncharacterized protein LOC121416727 n=1 Tax=Lytechinus variegatus TaxID=7654 RepID=UPI001BB27841|nr:uncharacterized protein LOC121416727 [Lytechinus variegatus]
MGFGLCNAPATFSRAMNLILRGLTWEIALAFLDDVLVLGKSFEEHLKNLRIVLNRFQQFELKLKPKKCSLFQTKVEFLGRDVDKTGIHLRAEHVQAVQSWPVPKNTREVERFLGLVNYHRVFLKDYAKVAAPLYALTGKQAFKWDEAHQCAFESIKHMLSTAPVLTLPNSTDGFVLDTDASDIALGAELIQIQNGEEKVIAYGSCVLAKEQRRYCVTRKELLAVVLFTRFYRHYLLGKPFLVRTDHSSLRWLLNFKRPEGQIARWIEELSQYDFHIEHRKGNKHVNADALSRIPQPPSTCSCYQLGSKLKDLPCGGCHHCERAHKRWAYFVEEVDDAVPLTKRSQVCEVSMTVPCTSESPLSISPQAKEIGELREIPSDSPPSISPQAKEISELRELTILRCSIPTVSAISLSDISDENFREAQEKETYFGPIRAWLESQTVPSQAEIMLWGAEQKFLWVNRDLLILKDGLLYWKKDEQLFVVVPRALREQIMQVNHDLPSSAHPGCDRTFAKIRQKYFWYHMKDNIQSYVMACPLCNRNKKPDRHQRFPLTRYHAGVPMETVHLDFLGPLPKTTNGNEYILMIVDQFTKWTEVIPLPSQTAEVTARAVVNEFFSRFGYPLQIQTDQGRNFESALFHQLCQLLHIQKTRTTAYGPSANGQVERYNRTLMAAVRCYVDKTQTQWDKYLPQIAGAIRATVNRSTGFTPNRLMLGREVNQPTDLVFPLPSSQERKLPSEFCKELGDAIQTAHDTARKNLHATQRTMKRDYDVRSQMMEN